jgi:hypothetical protein
MEKEQKAGLQLEAAKIRSGKTMLATAEAAGKSQDEPAR